MMYNTSINVIKMHGMGSLFLLMIIAFFVNDKCFAFEMQVNEVKTWVGGSGRGLREEGCVIN